MLDREIRLQVKRSSLHALVALTVHSLWTLGEGLYRRRHAAQLQPDLAEFEMPPTVRAIRQIRDKGSSTLAAIPAGLDEAGVPTPRGEGKWSPAQVKRTLEALGE